MNDPKSMAVVAHRQKNALLGRRGSISTLDEASPLLHRVGMSKSTTQCSDARSREHPYGDMGTTRDDSVRTHNSYIYSFEYYALKGYEESARILQHNPMFGHDATHLRN